VDQLRTTTGLEANASNRQGTFSGLGR